MRKRLFKALMAFCAAACVMTNVQMTSYAALTYIAENSVCYVKDHKYYNEVSSMAKTLSENLSDVEREYLYDVCMVSVFGKNYKKATSKYFADKICTFTKEELNSMQPGFLSNLLLTGSLEYKQRDRQELYTVNPVELNADGINEAGYQELKVLYTTFLEAKEKLANLDEATKIRTLHDFIVEKIDAPPAEIEPTARNHSMTAALADRVGSCNVYSNLFYIIGTSNGLTVKIDHDHNNHDCNYVFTNGKWLSMDIMYDDTSNSDYAYLTERCIWASQHTAATP